MFFLSCFRSFFRLPSFPFGLCFYGFGLGSKFSVASSGRRSRPRRNTQKLVLVWAFLRRRPVPPRLEPCCAETSTVLNEVVLLVLSRARANYNFTTARFASGRAFVPLLCASSSLSVSGFWPVPAGLCTSRASVRRNAHGPVMYDVEEKEKKKQTGKEGRNTNHAKTGKTHATRCGQRRFVSLLERRLAIFLLSPASSHVVRRTYT